jgi:hypothetical protein
MMESLANGRLVEGIIGGYNRNNTIAMCTPVLVPEETIAHTQFYTYTYFPQSPYQNRKTRIVASPHNFKKTEQLVLSRKVKTIQSFECNADRLINYAKNNGGITLLIEDIDEINGCISNLCKFEEQFRYCVFFGSQLANKLASKVSNDEPILYIDIYRLDKAIRVMDKRKMEGVAVIVGLCWKGMLKQKNISPACAELRFVASQHRENLLSIDGEMTIREYESIGNNPMYMLEQFNKMLDMATGTKTPKSRKLRATAFPCFDDLPFTDNTSFDDLPFTDNTTTPEREEQEWKQLSGKEINVTVTRSPTTETNTVDTVHASSPKISTNVVDDDF